MHPVVQMHIVQPHTAHLGCVLLLDTVQLHANILQQHNISKRICRHVSAPLSEPNIDIAVV
jgi:hypothetical protein